MALPPNNYNTSSISNNNSINQQPTISTTIQKQFPNYSNNNNHNNNKDTMKRSQIQSMPVRKNFSTPQNNFNNNNNEYYSGDQRDPKQVIPYQMAKFEAKHIILNEIKRLKESLKTLLSNRDELSQQLSIERTNMLSYQLANQTLAEKILHLERSSSALRELLKQKLGLHVYLELIESLNAMGAGAQILNDTYLNLSSSDKSLIKSNRILTLNESENTNNAKVDSNGNDINYRKAIESTFYPR